MRYLLYPLIAANVLMCWWCAYSAIEAGSVLYAVVSIAHILAAWLGLYTGRHEGWL